MDASDSCPLFQDSSPDKCRPDETFDDDVDEDSSSLEEESSSVTYS